MDSLSASRLGCLGHLLRYSRAELATKSVRLDGSSSVSRLSRRALITGSLGFLAATGTRVYSSSPLLVSASALLPISEETARRTTGSYAPRYIPVDRRRLRLQNHRVVTHVSAKSAFAISERSPEEYRRREFSVHYANASGEIRLFSPANSTRHLRAIKREVLRDWFNLKLERRTEAALSAAIAAGVPEPVARLSVESGNSLAWEIGAVELLEAGQIKDACDILFIGARLTARNVRLLDLLAGLAVRFPESAPSLDEIVATRTTSFRGGTDARAKKWLDVGSKWRERWSDRSRPIWWHHPSETRDFQWERTRSMKRPPPNPEARQRPVKIA
jgi:hypothetical protein